MELETGHCMRGARARGLSVNADPGAGLSVMLVEEGRADGEGGRDSPSSSGFLQPIGVLRRRACGGVAAGKGGGAVRLVALVVVLGAGIRLLWFDSTEPALQLLHLRGCPPRSDAVPGWYMI